MVESLKERGATGLTEALYPHQADIINTAYERKHFAILADMGVGKTRCAIELIKSYRIRHGLFHVLIIAPNTILENWENEVKRWSDLRPVILQGSKAKRLKLLKEPADIYILNYEALRILLEDLIKVKWNMLIADESQKLKGYKSLQSKSAFKLSQNVPYKLIMTGTPITNNPLDIFGQYRFLNPFIFGFSFYRFRARYAVMGGYLNYEIRKFINLDELHKIVHSCAIRITKDQCLSLPEKVYQTHQVELHSEQRRVYMQLAKDFISEIKGKTVTAPYILTRLMRLSQVTAGFIKSEDHEEINFETNPKLVLLKELIEALPSEEKVVIFCRFIKEIKNLMALCQENKWPWVAIYGETKDRQSLIDGFNDPCGAKVFIGQIETAGLGINLQSARYCIFLSNSYSHGSRLQAEDRLHRIGQSRSVTYIDIVARGTIDATILECLKTKKDLATKIVEEINGQPNQQPK